MTVTSKESHTRRKAKFKFGIRLYGKVIGVEKYYNLTHNLHGILRNKPGSQKPELLIY